MVVPVGRTQGGTGGVAGGRSEGRVGQLAALHGLLGLGGADDHLVLLQVELGEAEHAGVHAARELAERDLVGADLVDPRVLGRLELVEGHLDGVLESLEDLGLQVWLRLGDPGHRRLHAVLAVAPGGTDLQRLQEHLLVLVHREPLALHLLVAGAQRVLDLALLGLDTRLVRDEAVVVADAHDEQEHRDGRRDGPPELAEEGADAVVRTDVLVHDSFTSSFTLLPSTAASASVDRRCGPSTHEARCFPVPRRWPRSGSPR